MRSSQDGFRDLRREQGDRPLISSFLLNVFVFWADVLIRKLEGRPDGSVVEQPPRFVSAQAWVRPDPFEIGEQLAFD